MTRDRGDGTFDVAYDDGESETRVEESLLRLIERDDALAASRKKARIEEGSKVEGNYRGRGKWYPGKVTRDRGDGTFDVAYDDGEPETRVEESLLRLIERDDALAASRKKARIEEVEGTYRDRGKLIRPPTPPDRYRQASVCAHNSLTLYIRCVH